MATFDLGAEIDELRYDFTTMVSGWNPETGAGKGVIADPSRGDVRKFQRAMTAPLGLKGNASQAQIIDKLAALDEEEAEAANEAFIDAIVELCHGAPSRAELDAIGTRGLNRFLGWIMGKLLGDTAPTPPAAAMNGSLATKTTA